MKKSSYEKLGYLNEDFRLFHLSDKCDRRYDFHYHDFDKLIIFLKGNVNYVIEGKNYELKPYDIVLVRKNEIHKPIISTQSNYERIVLYLSGSFLAQYEGTDYSLYDCFKKARREHNSVIHLTPLNNTKMMEDIAKIEAAMDRNEYAHELFAKLYVVEFLLKLNEIVLKSGIEFSERAVYNEKIVAVTEYINTHLNEDLSIDELASRFYISKYHFMRCFKESTGYSVHQYVLEKRLLYAKQLVEDGEKITVACIQAGFKDYSTYVRASKRNEVSRKNT